MLKQFFIYGLLLTGGVLYASELAPSRLVNAQPELKGYENCIEGLVTSVEQKRFLFKAPWLWVDPKLYQMVEGVRVLLLNYKWLSTVYANRPILVADAHLISNAAQGCVEYQRGFEARVALFKRFFYGIGASVVTLTLGILLNMFAAVQRSSSKGRKDVVSAANSPSDQKPSASRHTHR